MAPFYRASGKQILRGNTHVADCTSPALASTIASLLNLPAWLDARADRCPSRLGARLYRIIADDLRARLHEEDKADG